jgi:hypothetical protein
MGEMVVQQEINDADQEPGVVGVFAGFHIMGPAAELADQAQDDPVFGSQRQRIHDKNPRFRRPWVHSVKLI